MPVPVPVLLQMRLRPLYTNPGAGVDEDAVVGANGGNGAEAQPAAELDHERCMELLQLALFAQEGGFEGGHCAGRGGVRGKGG